MASTRSVLIVGGSGFVGTHLALSLRERYKVFTTYRSHPIRIPGVTALPLAADNRNWAKRVAYTAKPDVIIYAAGSSDVARAEADPRMAESVHAGGPANLAEAAEILQPRFIYLSSCLVFDGMRGNYHESDTVLPATALGKTKLSAENFIRARLVNYTVIRSSPLIGRANGLRLSFLDRLRIRLELGERFELPDHELFSFANVSGLSDMVIRLIEGGPRNRTLHFGGLTRVSPYEWAVEFARRFGYDPALIVPERPGPESSAGAHRWDYSLNCTQAVESLKIKPLLLEESLDLIEKELVSDL